MVKMGHQVICDKLLDITFPRHMYVNLVETLFSLTEQKSTLLFSFCRIDRHYCTKYCNV